MFFHVGTDDQAVLQGLEAHFLVFIVGFLEGLPLPAAARLTEYAIATACFTGLPADTSALTFLRNASFEGDLTSGIT
jgi:hypothetical protein